MAWIVTLKNQLWKSWLKHEYTEVIAEVSESFGLNVEESWRAQILAIGHHEGAKISVRWSAGLRPHRLTVSVNGPAGKQRWVSRPDVRAVQIISKITEMLG